MVEGVEKARIDGVLPDIGRILNSITNTLRELTVAENGGYGYVGLDEIRQLMADMATLAGSEGAPLDISNAVSYIMRIMEKQAVEIDKLKLDLKEADKLRDELKRHGTEVFSAVEVDGETHKAIVGTLSKTGDVLVRVKGCRELGQRAATLANMFSNQAVVTVVEYKAPEDELS